MFPLINRTHYSILRAFTKPDELIKACKASGYVACGLCDFDSVSGAIEFQEACEKAGILPIIGCDFDKENIKIFARNLNGWKVLIGLITEYNFHNTLNLQLIADSADIIVVYANTAGVHHFFPNDLILKDCRYIKPQDEVLYRIQRAIAGKTTVRELTEETGGFALDLAIQPSDGMSRFLALVESYTILAPPNLPTFAGEKSEIDQIREKVEANFVRMVPKGKEAEYRDRLEKELKILELNKLTAYFLIVNDFVQNARNSGVLVGPGRGCFVPGSRVGMSNGAYIPINFIKIGDDVTDAFGCPQKVYDIMQYDIDEEIIQLEFDNEIIIRCTKEHEFATLNKGYIQWTEARYLNETDYIAEVTGRPDAKLKNKKMIPYKGKVYDLSVEGSHSYNIEGLGVHNSAAGCLTSFLLEITLIDPLKFNLLFSRFFNPARSFPKHISFDEYGFVDIFRDAGI